MIFCRDVATTSQLTLFNELHSNTKLSIRKRTILNESEIPNLNSLLVAILFNNRIGFLNSQFASAAQIVTSKLVFAQKYQR